MTLKSPLAVFVVGAMFLLVTTLAGMAEARGGGGRGGGGGGRGGGFSRSSAASGGSFSSRSASQRSARPSTREAGAVQRPAQQGSRQESASQRQQNRQTSSGERQQNRQDNQGGQQGNRDEAREDWQNQRNQAREDRQDFVEDEYHGGDWDDHWHGDDDVAAAFVVGAAVGVAASQSAYVTTLPCSGATVIVNGAPYYQCGSTWYSSGYMSGTVVYTVSSPPPGY